MKSYLLKIIFRYGLAGLFVLAFTNLSFAANKDWTGGGATGAWNLAANWSGGVPGNNDVARIGFIAYAGFQPVVTANQTCGSIIIGANGGNPITLTVNPTFTLTVTTAGAGTGNMTVNSAATVSIPGTGTLALAGSYGNSGTTTFGAGTLTVAGDFTNTTGTTTFGTGPSTLSGAFTNTAGSTNFGTGLVTFNATGTVFITMTPSAVLTFNNVLFTKGHFLFKTGGGSTASFAIASTGIFTLSNGANLNFPNTAGLTLYSDANGSATIAAIPVGCTLQAPSKVAVQRFIKGSSTDASKRGYRLITSTVYANTVGGSNVFNLKYLANSVILSGAGFAANGFDATNTSNPSIYLFREDDPPPPSNSTSFTTGYNWKGVAKINNVNLDSIGTQKKLTTANILDTTVTIPVANGILFYFRGNKTLSNGTTAGTKVSPPYNFPEDVTLSETGSLNMGNIPVTLWYAGSAGLGNTFSYTSTYTDNTVYTGSLIGGFNLVGNPYPSTINWEKYNNGAAPGALTGTVTKFVYEFNEFSRQYGVYEPVQGSDITSEFPAGSISINGATNLIASGQGFFVQATAKGQTLNFTENAKSNVQSNPAVLLKMMSTSAPITAGPKPVLRLKLSTDSANTDEVVIKLSDNASSKFVQGEDAWDLGGSGNVVNLSSFSSDSTQLAINYTPFPGPQPQVIRLFAGGTVSGTYQLDRVQLDNLPDLYRVWLKDGFTGDSVDLKKTTSYSFVIDKNNAATFGANRFTVVFSQDPAMTYRLLSFTASRIGNSANAEIDWTAANEQSSTNFTVERSTDGGATFNIAGGLQSTGAGTYSLMDKNTGPAQNLYRLKQEDINNTITYSDTLGVDFSSKNAVIVNAYPNPASNLINVDINAKSQGNVAYSIIINDSSGSMVSQATSAQSSWQTSVSNFLPGTYLVNVFDQHNNKLIGQAKFVKL